jgi:hypothetical protein
MIEAVVKVTPKRSPKDQLKFLKASLDRVKDLEVYVGIPQEESTRTGSGQINNAELLYIHTNGSPLRNIPARPVIEPAIAAPGNKERITKFLALAAKAAMDGKPELAERHLHRAGQAGMNAARNWFTDPRNGWAPNQPDTVERKLGKLKGKQQQAALAAFAAGEPTYMFKGREKDVDQPLVDTGQLRAAIRYIVVPKGSVKPLPEIWESK